MKRLKINHRSKQIYSLVDDDIYLEITKYKWFITDQNYVWRYDYTNGWRKAKKQYLHRYLMAAIKGTMVDHIDRNPLNNQMYNLRFATQSQQNMNTRTRSDNTSGHRDVYWEKRRNCWRVCLNWGGKQIHVGQFVSKDKAIKAYKSEAKKFYGNFARD